MSLESGIMTDLAQDVSSIEHRDGSPSLEPAMESTEQRGTDPFVTLFEKHFPRLHRYLNRLGGDPELASELAQEAFVRLFQRNSPPDDPEAWLFTVGTNLLRNAGSKRARRTRLLDAHRGRAVHSDETPSPEATTLATEDRRRVRNAIERLAGRDQELLMLFSEGYSYREMATILSLKEASVGTLLRRAKHAFRAAFEESSDAS